MPRIVSTEQLGEHHTAYEIEAPEIAGKTEMGHMVMVRWAAQVLFTPHAVADFARDKGTVTIVANASMRPIDDDTVDMTGPIGRIPEVGRAAKVVCVAEGLGVAALIPRLQDLKRKNVYTIVVAGYASKDAVYWQDRLDALSDELYTITEDGSFGVKGPIKQTVKAVCQLVPDIERALAVGPLSFLKACASATRGLDIPTWISLAAAVENEAQMTPPDTNSEGSDKPFDWQNAADLNAHETDFDQLAEMLGIALVK